MYAYSIAIMDGDYLQAWHASRTINDNWTESSSWELGLQAVNIGVNKADSLLYCQLVDRDTTRLHTVMRCSMYIWAPVSDLNHLQYCSSSGGSSVQCDGSASHGSGLLLSISLKKLIVLESDNKFS